MLDHGSGHEHQRQADLDAVERPEHQATDSEPILTVTPGARNFSGASMNEMAITMPDQRSVTATATAGPAFMRQ